MSRALPGALLCLLFGACRTLPPPFPAELVDTPAGQLSIQGEEQDPGARARVTRALEAAGPALARWGTLSTPVRVVLLPDHAALEARVHKRDAWLRGWATYDDIYLQSPSSWNPPDGPLEELVLHELTHCVMFQSASDRAHWPDKHIPTWFREGLASVTAHQDYDRLPLTALARFLALHPRVRLLEDADALEPAHRKEVYSAAHHAFAFFLARFGEEDVRRLFAQMRGGADFRAAFLAVTGEPLAAFAEGFEAMVRARTAQPFQGLPRTGGLSLPSTTR